MDITQEFITLGEILLSMVLGGLIGFEREAEDKPAGLRTHMLVAGASALLVVLGARITDSYAKEFTTDLIDADPVRVMQAIIVGISFLGTGTIFQRKNSRVEGLTTAASILFTAGIGIAVALQEFVLAIGSTLLVLSVVELLQRLEKRLWGKE